MSRVLFGSEIKQGVCRKAGWKDLVESELGKGCDFKFTLPLDKTCLITEL